MLFVQRIPQTFNWIEISGIWKPSQHQFHVMFHKLFLSTFCSVSGCIILLKKATDIRKYCCQVGGTCQSNILMNSKIQDFPAEHHTASTSLSFSHSVSWHISIPQVRDTHLALIANSDAHVSIICTFPTP